MLFSFFGTRAGTRDETRDETRDGFMLDKKQETIFTIFENTAQGHSDNVVNLITENNFDINHDCLDSYGNTPLHIVTICNNAILAQKLIEMGGNIHQKNIFDETPWNIAIRKNQLEMIKVLLEIEPNNTILRNKINMLEAENKSLRLSIIGAKEENKVLKRRRDDDCEERDDNLKRFRLEYDVVKKENVQLKKSNLQLKKSNIQLKKDNTSLETTVKTLRSSFKKE